MKTFLLLLLVSALSEVVYAAEADPAESIGDACYNFSTGNPSKKEFYSPNYPYRYPENMKCTLLITADPNYIISLDFLDPFYLEDSPTCTYDSVEVRDGQDRYAPVIATVCGTENPGKMYTTDRYMWLQFSSDGSLQYSGFRAVYQYVKVADKGEIYPSITQTEACYNFTIGNRERKEFYSPNYPNYYPQNTRCTLLITADPGHKVKLDFQGEFDIEHSPTCLYDKLEVRDGFNENSPLIAGLCGGKAPDTIFSTGRYMLLQFSDNSNAATGFKAIYDYVPNQKEGFCPPRLDTTCHAELTECCSDSDCDGGVCCYENCGQICRHSVSSGSMGTKVEYSPTCHRDLTPIYLYRPPYEE